MENRDRAMCTEAEFSQIYQRNVKLVYRICYLHMKNSADAEDAVQTVFYKYIKAPKAFNDVEHERAWFITIARNTCRDVLRSFWYSKKAEGQTAQDVPCPDKRDSGDLLEKLLELPLKYSQVLYLYYYEEYSVKEISQLLARNESTIRTQLSKGRERLKQKIGGYYERRTDQICF